MISSHNKPIGAIDIKPKPKPKSLRPPWISNVQNIPEAPLPEPTDEPMLEDYKGALGEQYFRMQSILETPLTRYKLQSWISGLPVEIAEQLRKKAIHEMKVRKYGGISQRRPSLVRAVKRIPANIAEIAVGLASLVVGLPVLARKTGEEAIQGIPAKDWTVSQIGRGMKEHTTDFARRVKEDPALTLGFAAERYPVDTAIIMVAGWAGLGGLVKAGRHIGSRITGSVPASMPVRSPIQASGSNVAFPRHYSDNPLTRVLIQQPFDEVLNRFPKSKEALAKHKEGGVADGLRRVYDELADNEKGIMQREVLSKMEKLSPEEKGIMIPFLEGRLHFEKDLPKGVQNLVSYSKGTAAQKQLMNTMDEFDGINISRVRDFEKWYREFQQKIEDGFDVKGILSKAEIDDVLFQSVAKATGLSRKEIKDALGSFVPAYVTQIKKGTPDTVNLNLKTATKASVLEKRKYTAKNREDLQTATMLLASSFVNYRQSRAFFKEFAETFGIKTKMKNIKETDDGLLVGGTLYADHIIFSAKNYLTINKNEINKTRKIREQIDDVTTLDDAFLDIFLNSRAIIKETRKTKETNAKRAFEESEVYIVPRNAATRVESYASPLVSARFESGMNVFWDTPTQMWKASVLALTPAWMINNAVGNIYFNTFAGVGGMSYVRGILMSKYDDLIPDNIKHASFANVIKRDGEIQADLQFASARYLETIKNLPPVRALEKAVDIGYKVNTWVEQKFVRPLYISIARRKAKKMLKNNNYKRTNQNILDQMKFIKNDPKLSKEIMDEMKEILPVFNILGNSGKKVGKRIVPFLNWFKFMTLYSASLPRKHPFKLVGAMGLMELTEEDRKNTFIEMFPDLADIIERQGRVPKRFDGLFPLWIDEKTGSGVFFNTTGMNPFTTLAQLISGDVFNTLNPIIRIPIERAVGIKGRKAQRVDTAKPILVEADERGTIREVEKPNPNLLMHIGRQFPQFKLLEAILTPAAQYSTGTLINPQPKIDLITGEYKFPISQLDKVLNYMGVGRKTINIESWLDRHRTRIRRDLAKTHRHLQFSKEALTLQEHTIILRKLLKDPKIRAEILRETERRAKFKQKGKIRDIRNIMEHIPRNLPEDLPEDSIEGLPEDSIMLR